MIQDPLWCKTCEDQPTGYIDITDKVTTSNLDKENELVEARGGKNLKSSMLVTPIPSKDESNPETTIDDETTENTQTDKTGSSEELKSGEDAEKDEKSDVKPEEKGEKSDVKSEEKPKTNGDKKGETHENGSAKSSEDSNPRAYHPKKVDNLLARFNF